MYHRRTPLIVLLWITVVLGCSPPSDDDDSTGDDDDFAADDDDSAADDEDSECPPPFDEVGQYGRFLLDGWPVHMRLELLQDDIVLGCAVFDHLTGDLATVRNALNGSRIERLRQVNIWIEVDEPQFPGAVYHPSAGWLADNGYPTEWAEGIQIGNAQNYLDWTSVQPAIVLHELSHAWHHQVVGYNDPSLLAAYESAMASGLYDAVEYANGTIQEAYATTNVQEYFAELSEAWFWSNDFQPFDRAELLTFDPTGATAVEQAWAVVPR